jgi:hypothetical protein
MAHLLLTARKNLTTGPWWQAVGQASDRAPQALRTLFEGETQVRVTRDEADEALGWAIRQPGWTRPAPVFLVEWEPV